MTRNLRRLVSPMKRMGGKANLSRRITQHIPAHDSYIEVFGGAASVLFRKSRPKGQEVYNDADGLWVNTLTCVRDHNQELAELIHATPYSRAEFYEARAVLRRWRRGEVTLAPLELASRHFVVIRQSFSADGNSWSTSSFGGENRPRLWARLPLELRLCLERLRGVYIEQRDYTYILERYDHERAAFYIDPPYLHVEGAYYDVNRKDGFDHLALRNAVEDLKASVVISYYAHPEIESLYSGWRLHRWPVTVHAGDVKRQETELLIVRTSAFGRRRRRFRDIFEGE